MTVRMMAAFAKRDFWIQGASLWGRRNKKIPTPWVKRGDLVGECSDSNFPIARVHWDFPRPKIRANHQ